MTRKRLNALLALGIMAVYALCFFITLNSGEALIGRDFNSVSQDFCHYQLSDGIAEFTDGRYKSYTPQEFVNAVYDSASPQYPTGIALYSVSVKPELLAANTSHIFGSKIEKPIDLEPYLTDEMKAQVVRFAVGKSNAYLIVERFCYNEQNGEILPVSLDIRSQDDFRVENLTLTFSSARAEKEISVGSGEYESLDSVNVYFNFLYPERANRKKAEKIANYLHSGRVAEEYQSSLSRALKDLAEEPNSGGGWFESDAAEWHNTFRSRNDTYYLVTVMEQDVTAATLSSGQFLTEIGNITLVFAVLCVFIFIFSNKLYSKNKRLNEARQAFISAAAHELKTPLTVIENRAEFIAEKINPAKNDEYIHSIYSESQRMDKLVRELLQYNRLASGQRLHRARCSLSEIAAAEAEKYRSLAEEKGVELSTDIAADVTVKGNVDMLALVADNYLSNAVKHTAPGGRITVSLNSRCFSVFNEGEPIPREYRAQLFEVLAKTDAARKNDGSTGMGLAVCKQILELHKFRYGFENQPNGVAFYFNF